MKDAPSFTPSVRNHKHPLSPLVAIFETSSDQLTVFDKVCQVNQTKPPPGQCFVHLTLQIIQGDQEVNICHFVKFIESFYGFGQRGPGD